MMRRVRRHFMDGVGVLITHPGDPAFGFDDAASSGLRASCGSRAFEHGCPDTKLYGHPIAEQQKGSENDGLTINHCRSL